MPFSGYVHPGRLDRLITIEQNTPTTTSGEPVPAWATFATVYAMKSDQRGREFFDAQQVVAERTTVFRIRWLAGVTELMRIVFDSITYDIKAISEVGRHDALDLFCTADNP